ncbi:MAG TPA: aspartyl protease family protein [Caulobacteraceae bacterium]|nr:aspartyl protease family protein [Caulobacteraceae bacterium]
MTMSAAVLVTALAASIWVTGAPLRAQTPVEPPSAVASPEVLKVIQDPTSRLTLPVMIDGQGPFDFLIDTGADRTVISRQLAAKLDLPDGPTVLMHESAGDDDVKTVLIDHLAIGARIIRHVEAPALEADDLGAAGILGVDALRDLHLVMDFKAMRLSSSPSRQEPLDPETIVVRGRSRYGQLILIDSKVRGVDVLVVLDSGSQLSLGNPALLELLTGHAAGHEPRVTTQIVSVTGRKLTVELDDIAETKVGGVVIRNMPMAFADLPIFGRFGLIRQPALLLGMDVLSKCSRVTIDLRRREATFTLN